MNNPNPKIVGQLGKLIHIHGDDGTVKRSYAHPAEATLWKTMLIKTAQNDEMYRPKSLELRILK